MAGTIWDFHSFATGKRFIFFWISSVLEISDILLGDIKSWEELTRGLNSNRITVILSAIPVEIILDACPGGSIASVALLKAGLHLLTNLFQVSS